jgi:hypothetical protein
MASYCHWTYVLPTFIGLRRRTFYMNHLVMQVKKILWRGTLVSKQDLE